MFLSFTNFYKQLIIDFSKIVILLPLLLKIMILSVLAKVACTRANKNKLDTDDNNGIYDNRIDYRIENLLSSMKKMGFKASFFIFKASLTFS